MSRPGSGKSPAFQNGFSQPICLQVQKQSQNPFCVDEFTDVVFFDKAIISKEVSQFFKQIQGVKEKCKLDVQWLIQLYDSATWVYTKEDESARQV